MPEKVLKKLTSNIDLILEAERFIVNTHAMKEELLSLKKIPSDRIDVIPHGPSGNYRPVQKSPQNRKKYIDKYTKDDYILCVGTIEPRKNLPVLIKAFKLLKEREFPAKLVIAGGKGWQYEDTVKLPRNLGIEKEVIFTGYVDEETMLYLYNFAVLSVYPSIYEGFGIPVIEAMSCGTPVIVSNIPSLTEVAGEAAVTFSPQDHEELAHTIEKIFFSGSLRTELGEKGHEKAREYSWDRTISLTIQTYRKALGKDTLS
jgi:glycosyltransferase involved in cell wall biosynthesis